MITAQRLQVIERAQLDYEPVPTSYGVALGVRATSWGTWHASIVTPDGWLPPLVRVDMRVVDSYAADLDRLGYRRLWPEVEYFGQLYALQPLATALRVGRVMQLTYWRVVRQLFRWHLIDSCEEDYVHWTWRDLRPNLWPFNRECRSWRNNRMIKARELAAKEERRARLWKKIVDALEEKHRGRPQL